jgi:hypothetical protein
MQKLFFYEGDFRELSLVGLQMRTVLYVLGLNVKNELSSIISNEYTQQIIRLLLRAKLRKKIVHYQNRMDCKLNCLQRII